MNQQITAPFSRKLDTVVEREWNIGLLAHALNASGYLNCVYGGFPKSRYQRLGIPSDQIRTFPVASLWNYAAQKARLPKMLRLSEPETVGKWVARQRDLAGVVSCNGTAYRYLFPRLRDSGRILVIERGSMAPDDHFLFQERAKQEAGYPCVKTLPNSVLDDIEKSKLAHFITAGSKMIADSYVKLGFSRERILSCPYGIDADRFAFRQRTADASRPLRICMVGMVGLRKGILRLIRINEWAKSRGFKTELWLVGPVDAQAQALLARTNAPYRLFGVQKGAALVEILYGSDIYGMCSYEEGFPLSLLEAMATGMPAIVSDDTGAREAITEGADGVILKEFSNEEFEGVLKPLFSNIEGMLRMSPAAREKIKSHYTLQHYAERIHSEYTRMFDMIEANGGRLAPAWNQEKKP